MQKALGEKAMKQFKENQLNKFKVELERKQKEVRHKLEDLYSNFGYWDSQIQQVQERSSGNQIKEVQEEIYQVESKITSYNDQLKIIIGAEDELAAKIETMIESKKKEIGRGVSKLMAQNGGGIDFNRIK